MKFDDLITALDKGKITPYQIYNTDIDYPQYFAVDHYIRNKNDEIDINQKLHKVFIDIEVYSENQFDFDRVDKGEHPISVVTIFSNNEKIFHVFLLLINKNVEKWSTNPDPIDYFKKQLIDNNYLKDGVFDISLKTYTSDNQLIKDVWNKIHELDPVILSGYNSDFFDFPYMYYRLKYLYNNDSESVSKIMSKFGNVSINRIGGNAKVDFVEYVNADICYLYKPRDDGGLNLGKKQPSYTLDFISEKILGVKKLEYKKDGLVLDTFYEQDPLNYTLYNIIDVCLVYMLDQKLKLIDQYNMYRRLMKTSLDSGLRGPTILFDTLVYHQLADQKNFIRFGISDETQETIDKNELSKLPKPLTSKNIKWTVNNIDKSTYLKITRKFEGAYVKDSPGKIYDQNDGLIIDLDASLPPTEKIFVRNNNGIFWGEIGDYHWNENDETLTWDKNNNTCWKRINKKLEHDWDGELITFITETGKKVCVTANHSIFAIQKKIKTDTPYLVDARDLEIGDSIVGYINFEPGVNKKLKNPELIGFWLSDGWTNQNKTLFYIAKTDRELLEIFEPDITNIKIKRKFDGIYQEEWVGKITDPVIKKELMNFIIHTRRKNFFEILNYDRENRKKIWDGMFLADGTYHGLGVSSVTTPTERLCKYRLEELIECFISAHTINWKPRLNQNGIDNVPTKFKDKSNRYGPSLVIPEVYGSKKGYTNHLSKLKLSANHRHPYEKLIPTMPYIKNSYSNQVGLEKIVKIEKSLYKGKVYDISVEETERFFAGTGIGVHNSSLYPSMIRQNNISFDTYYGRILDPVTTSKTINTLDEFLQNKKDSRIKSIYTTFLDLTSKYINSDKINVLNTNDAVQQYYYIISYLFNKILNSEAKNIRDILQPKDFYHYILLKKYLVTFLNLIDEIHDKNREYNNFCYDYLLNNEFNNKTIYVIENINQPNIRIIQLLAETINEYIVKNQLILTLTGCLFYKHEKKISLFTGWLQKMATLRKQYIKERDKYKREEDDYSFFDSRQSATKVAMNTSYGLYGQSTFRYSNNWLAKTITCQGRLTLKISQQVAEDYLKEFSK